MIWDTNAVSALFEEDPAFQVALQEETTISIPFAVAGEYWFGIEGSNQKATLSTLFKEWLGHVELLWPDHQTVMKYGELSHLLKTRGRQLSHNDIWIAALALQHQLPVLSRDLDFDHVPGVRRVGW